MTLNLIKTNLFKVKFIPLLSLILLSGCSTYSETFDCPPGQGIGCKSLSKVNQMVEEGQLPLGELSEQDGPAQEHPPQDKPVTRPLPSKKPLNLTKHETLTPSTHLKIWIAGYEDREGIYHAPSYIYASHRQESLK